MLINLKKKHKSFLILNKCYRSNKPKSNIYISSHCYPNNGKPTLSPPFFQFYRGQEVGEGKKEENWPRWLRDMMKSMEWRGEGRGRGEHFGGLERGCRISGES